MRNLLQDADRDRLVAPLAGLLAGVVPFGGAGHRALSAAPGSDFFPLDANAHAAELLLMPGLHETHRALGDALLDFVIALADAPRPARQAVAPRLDIVRDDPAGFVVRTPHFRLTGNLSRGELVQTMTGLGDVGLRHGGNLVEFRIGLDRACVDVEDGIVSADILREDDAVVLRHVSTIRARAGLLAKRDVEAGTLEMRYAVRGDSPAMQVTARFTAARRLTRVRVSTAVDGVDTGGLVADAARLREDGAWRDAAPPPAPGAVKWSVGKAVSHVAVGRAGWPDDAPVLHLRPGDPSRVMSVTAQAMTGGALHWLLLRHGPVTLGAGESLTGTDERLIARGDPVEDPASPAGLALHVVATALMLDARGAWRERLGAARRQALLAFAHRHAARLEVPANGDDTAWAALGADALRRAGDADAAGLQARFIGRLGAAASPLAALALARAAEPDGERIAMALDGVAADAAPRDAALTARAAGAVVLAAENGGTVPEAAIERARTLHRSAIATLRPLIRARAGILEVSGPDGLTTDLQALTALALMAPDRLAFAPTMEHSAR
jgi:hypothetical protein